MCSGALFMTLQQTPPSSSRCAHPNFHAANTMPLMLATMVLFLVPQLTAAPVGGWTHEMVQNSSMEVSLHLME